MLDKSKKYCIIIPLGIVLFIVLAIILLPLDLDTFWQWWLISALVIAPMWGLGIFLDYRVFKIKGTLKKSITKPGLADKDPANFMKCPHCNQSIRKDSEFCSYCSKKV